jgi:exosortase/archaeosortase family protein
VGCPPLRQRHLFEWLVALSAAFRHIWLEPLDPLQIFRATVLMALFVILLRTPDNSGDRVGGVFSIFISLVVAGGIFWMPACALGIALMAWRHTGRWPAVVMALLILPWDPWVAADLQWPLQVVTAELGGLLAGISPSYEIANPVHGDTVYLRIPCASFCSIPHHNVDLGQIAYEPFRINEQCAGLNQVEGLFALTGAVLLLLGQGLRPRHDLLFIAAAPVLAVVVNGVRVAMSVWLSRWVDRGPWEGWLHDLPSYIVFAIAVFAMAVTARRLAERQA